MKVAILYICTGKYDLFWKDFYNSCEKYFLKDYIKNYFVFTDAVEIFNEDNESIKKVYQKNLNWPGNTLFRFNMFKKVIEDLKMYDYIFFFNANMLFLKEVNDSILPDMNEVLVVRHPGYYNKNNKAFSYERNEKSLAFIPEGIGDVYVCGGINGGTSNSYIHLINTLSSNINADFQNNIIAKWHDESHINRYIMDHKFKILDCEYAYPEGWDIPFEKKILIRDKKKYGGHNFLRGIKLPWYKMIIEKAKKIIVRR